jgi:membrane protease subunit HflK
LLQEASGYKLRVENEAQGNASRFNQILAQYKRAPEVTRNRLYLDAQEQIMSSVSKVIVDQKGGNSLLYLPLDKLLAETAVKSPVAPAEPAASATQSVPSTPVVDVNAATQHQRDNSRSRDRR